MRLWSVALIALMAALPAAAENRGVVIDNGSYRNAPDVPGADASQASDAMKGAGFRTVKGANLSAEDIRKALSDLSRPDDDPGVRIVLLNGRFVHNATETWFLGTDAKDTSLMQAGVQGVPLSSIFELMKAGKPGSVLLLGTGGGRMNLGAGLQNGLGQIRPPSNVTVLSGPATGVSLAAQDLLIPGTSIDEALSRRPAMGIQGDGNGRLVLIPARGGNGGGNDGGGLEADRAAWARAADANSANAYREYLDKFPRGVYSAAARERLGRLTGEPVVSDNGADERDAWAHAAAVDTPAALNEFLSKYPNGRYADAARRRLDSLSRPVTGTGETGYPFNRGPGKVTAPVVESPAAVVERNLGLSRDQRAAVQRQLSRLGYSVGQADGIFGSRSRTAIGNWQRDAGLSRTTYLTGPQVNRIAEESRRLDSGNRDRDYWQQTGARGGEANLRAYLQRYPNGAYADQARRMLRGDPVVEGPNGNGIQGVQGDESTWRWARQQGTAGAYDAYLDKYPRGKYARQARQLRDNLNAGNEAARREEASLGLNPSTRLMVEERLQRAGMRPGPVDGQFTAQTREALRRYQMSRNLRVTGYVTQETAISLLAASILR